MKRFVSLIAVSSEKQATPDKISLSDQRDSISKEIARWNGVLAEELEIPGHTRAYTSLQEAEQDIPAYKHLHELIVAGAFDVLIFFNYSRLARDIGLGGNVVSLCQKHKIVLYPASSPPSDLEFRHDAMGLFLASFGLTSSHNEIAEITRRHKMGMVERIRRGDFPARIPWGWTVRYTERGERIIEIDQQAKAVFDIICGMYLEGRGSHTIADHMNSTGAKTPAGNYKWLPANVNRAMRKIWSYAGLTWVNKFSKTGREYVEAPSKWPALIDRETAERIEAEWNRRRHGGRWVESPHRFSGMVYCADCGHVMRCAWTNSNGGKYRYEVLRCPNGHPQIMAHRVETALRDMMESDQYQSLVDMSMVDGTQGDRGRLEALINAEQKEIDRCADRVSRINEMYADLSIDKPERDRLLARVKEQERAARASLKTHQDEARKAEHDATKRERLEWLQQVYTMLLDTNDVVGANSALRQYVVVWAKNSRVDTIEIDYYFLETPNSVRSFPKRIDNQPKG